MKYVYVFVLGLKWFDYPEGTHNYCTDDIQGYEFTIA